MKHGVGGTSRWARGAVGRGLVWVALGSAACVGADPTGESGGDPPACADDALAMTIGTGEGAFEPMADGDEATIVNGPQGGWHLWTAAELTGVGPEVTVIGSAVLKENGMILARPDDQPHWLDLASSPGGAVYDGPSCSGSFFGLETRLDDFTPPNGTTTLEVICALVNREIAFTVTVTDVASGEIATETVAVIGRPDEATAQSCRAMN